MYIKKELNIVLSNNGYKRVYVKNDWKKFVKNKYKQVLDENIDGTTLDTRCPATISAINDYLNNKNVIIPKIHPILIHCGIELSEREDLKGTEKIITTPCESLAYYGNNLNLKDTIFISWKKFIKELKDFKNLKNATLEDSPIPLGYFDLSGYKITSISGKENIEDYFKKGLYQKDDLIEMLYCNNGCNNGDGVIINE